jgi:hypothetical protein
MPPEFMATANGALNFNVAPHLDHAGRVTPKFNERRRTCHAEALWAKAEPPYDPKSRSSKTRKPNFTMKIVESMKEMQGIRTQNLRKVSPLG